MAQNTSQSLPLQPIPTGLFSSESEKTRLIAALNQDDQQEAQRRQIRLGYRQLQDELIERKQDLINPADEENLLQEKLKVVNTLFVNVKQPREGSLDSTSLLQIADLGMKKAQALQTDFVRFYPNDFCEKIKVLFGGEADVTNTNPLTHEQWGELGESVSSLFKKTPVIRFMCGSFERGDVSFKKQPRAAKPDKILDKTTGKATQPAQLSRFETEEGNELTTKYVEHVLNTLWSIYDDKMDKQPVDFFEFVTHPTEFGQTVENIFYTSFLIRDGHAKLSLDDEGIPVIEPIQKDDNDTNEDSADNRQQLVMELTPAQWRAIVEAFEIEEPVIQDLVIDID